MNLLPADSAEAKADALTALELAINRAGWSVRALYYSYTDKRYICTLSRVIQNGGGRRRKTESTSGHGNTICEAIQDAASDAIRDLAAGPETEDPDGG